MMIPGGTIEGKGSIGTVGTDATDATNGTDGTDDAHPIDYELLLIYVTPSENQFV